MKIPGSARHLRVPAAPAGAVHRSCRSCRHAKVPRAPRDFLRRLVMKRMLFGLAICTALFFPIPAHAQGTNGALSGTITDANQAAVPGATVTSQNIKTGLVTTTTTNEAGVYNF